MPTLRRSPWLDRIIGVLLGVLLGLAVVIVFVFYFSEETIDQGRISGVDTGRSQGQGGRSTAPLVRVVGGKPPPSGPVRLDFDVGRRARFVVQSDQAIGIEVPGYGVSRTVGAGRSTVAFAASRPGQYPVVVAGSMIDIATMRVTRR